MSQFIHTKINNMIWVVQNAFEDLGMYRHFKDNIIIKLMLDTKQINVVNKLQDNKPKN